MQLDYVKKTDAYTLRVPRGEGDPKELMKVHGLDFSTSASNMREAVLFTREPYAAASFSKYASPAALARLKPIVDEVALSWKADSDAHIACPMDKELWPFQRASVSYALRRRNTLIGDQPGLGKTPIAICYANEIKAKRVLVICPANIRIQWVNRIREWTTMRWPYIVYPILSGRHGVHPQAEWTVVSYDLARTEAIGKTLALGLYDLLVLDEAHYVKTIDSNRTQAIFGDHTGFCRKEIRHELTDEIIGYTNLFKALSSRCGAVLALTGTPLPNRPREAYTIARGLCFDSIDWMSEDRFKLRFNPSARLEGKREDGTTYFYTREEVGRAGELQNRLRANFMVRHLKRDVMPQLKLPIYDLIYVDETGPVKQALEAESLLDIDPDDLAGGNIEVNGTWAIVRQMMGKAIAPQVAGYADMLLDGGEEKLVIFAWHVEVLNILQAALAKHGVVRIDGSTSPKQRAERIKIFQHDPNIQVMLGNTLSLGTGTDGLQEVSCHVLIAEPDPVPGNNEQAVDRLDRGGQVRTVQADLFVAPKSILEKILSMALHKRKNTHAALDQQF